MQLFLQMEQLFTFALHHTGNGDACPTAYHLCDIIGSDLLANEGVAVLGICQLSLDGLDVVFESLKLRVADLCHLAIVALALGTLSLVFQVLYLLLVLLDLVYQLALTFPLGTELGLLLTQLGDVAVELIEFSG